jgi:glutamate--cysteine ligase
VARSALAAPLGSGTARDAARELLGIARRGLGRQDCGEEASYLAPMEEIAESGVTRAERMLQAWERGGLGAVIALTRV